MKKIILIISLIIIIALAGCTQKTTIPPQNEPPKQEANIAPENTESQEPIGWMGDQTKKFVFENCDLSFDETINKGTVNEITTKGKIDATITINYMQRYLDGKLSRPWTATTWLKRATYDYPIRNSIFSQESWVITIQNAEAINDNTFKIELKTNEGIVGSIENFSIFITSNKNSDIKCIGKETK
jgi:hypothetical protein